MTKKGREPKKPVESELVTPREVAAALRVEPRRVRDWAVAGMLRCIITPGGHRRYYKADIEAIRRGEPPEGDTKSWLYKEKLRELKKVAEAEAAAAAAAVAVAGTGPAA